MSLSEFQQWVHTDSKEIILYSVGEKPVKEDIDQKCLLSIQIKMEEVEL